MRVFDRAVVRVLPAVPRSVVRGVAAPYIAGETLDDACRVVAELNAARISATVHVLGEDVSRPEEAETMARAYHEALEAIVAARRPRRPWPRARRRRSPAARLRAVRRRWYEYSLRRLQENPRGAGYVARDLIGRLVPGR